MDAVVSQAETRQRSGASACVNVIRAGGVEHTPKSSNVPFSMRSLSRTGAELVNGAPADFVILEPAALRDESLLQPARVGRIVNDPARDQLAVNRVLGRVCRK